VETNQSVSEIALALGYTVNVASAGTYTFDFRVATPNSASLHVEVNGANVTGSVSVPSTGGWQTWTSVRKTVTLSAGLQTMVVYFDTGNVNLNSITATSGSSGSSGGGSTPFSGVALAIPGWIQAEDFDNGGQGVTYSDNSPGNSGGAYRATDVDIEPTSSGGYAVAYVAAGEWLRYTVNVAAGGTYTVTARVASAGSGGTFHIEFDGSDKTGAMQIPNTGGWQSYQDLTATVDSSGLCLFVTFALGANEVAEQLAAVTGMEITPDEVVQIGERVWNLERLFNLAAGLKKEDDTLPKRLLKDALKFGPQKGSVNHLDVMLPEYYKLRGWDEDGRPTKERLAELGLEKLVMGPVVAK
jgi:hypothetical protein